MKKVYWLLGFVGLIIIIAAAWQLSSTKKNLSPNQPQIFEVPLNASATIPISAGDEATFSSEAMVLSPKQNEIVSSPLKVEGQALGSWFFEASLPVKLLDQNGNLIASHYGTAESDWMTEKPVKFNSEIVFTTAATSGYLLVSKDNPSGLPENDGSIKVPVRFK